MAGPDPPTSAAAVRPRATRHAILHAESFRAVDLFLDEARRSVAYDVAKCYFRCMATGTPVRLSSELAARARSAAITQERSLTDQVEHWARLGQAVEEAVLAATVHRLKARSHDQALSTRLAGAKTP